MHETIYYFLKEQGYLLGHGEILTRGAVVVTLKHQRQT